MKRFSLIDGVAMNKAHPDTFEIPTTDEIAALKDGDHVKLGFKMKRKDCPSAERMWVKIVARKGGDYCGTIANSPVFVNAEFGDLLLFERKHILSILGEQD